VLTRLLRLPQSLRLRLPGFALRVGVVAASLVSGLALATLTLPAVDQLQDNMSAHVGVDAE
jgi:hypothetical protein